MAIVGPNGQPIQSGKAKEESSYQPENMIVIASLINKITETPELTFQIMIPFEQFEFYMENQQLFTLTINNFVGFAYGTKILNKTAETQNEVYEWTQEAASKYSVTLSEPLAVDAVFTDSSTPSDYEDFLASLPEQEELNEERSEVN